MMDINKTVNCTSCNSTDYVTIYQVPTEIIVLLSVLYGSISVVAIIGNFMVIWIVASSKSMQSVTNYFICNLALADIVIGFFAIPFEVSFNILCGRYFGTINFLEDKGHLQVRSHDSEISQMDETIIFFLELYLILLYSVL